MASSGFTSFSMVMIWGKGKHDLSVSLTLVLLGKSPEGHQKSLVERNLKSWQTGAKTSVEKQSQADWGEWQVKAQGPFSPLSCYGKKSHGSPQSQGYHRQKLERQPLEGEEGGKPPLPTQPAGTHLESVLLQVQGDFKDISSF